MRILMDFFRLHIYIMLDKPRRVRWYIEMFDVSWNGKFANLVISNINFIDSTCDKD